MCSEFTIFVIIIIIIIIIIRMAACKIVGLSVYHAEMLWKKVTQFISQTYSKIMLTCVENLETFFLFRQSYPSILL